MFILLDTTTLTVWKNIHGKSLLDVKCVGVAIGIKKRKRGNVVKYMVQLQGWWFIHSWRNWTFSLVECTLTIIYLYPQLFCSQILSGYMLVASVFQFCVIHIQKRSRCFHNYKDIHFFKYFSSQNMKERQTINTFSSPAYRVNRSLPCYRDTKSSIMCRNVCRRQPSQGAHSPIVKHFIPPPGPCVARWLFHLARFWFNTF